ncbi:hypothetical protein TIFTF001_018444 [Ficus carica]|uniref:Uncharacterized protein n=1 Tax=Ficus carica TaxID=3494 RepID=A0AA88DAS2_FICCA|nr:hypothetical protein TIFTF001_018444 [Ficus carica]
MGACCSWSSGEVVIARQKAILSYAMTESTACCLWSSREVAIASPLRSDCGRDSITTDGMPSDKDDNKATLATTTSQSRQG